MQDNLSNRIYSAQHEQGAQHLTDLEKNTLVKLVGKGCREKTKDALARRVRLPLVLWPDYGIYRRVLFDARGVVYCPGQSWTDEMRVLRECLLGD